MNRREFLLASSCLLATPAVALSAQAYEPGLVKQLLAKGKTVFVDYTTEWCTTCAAQKRTLARLLTENPAYDEKIEFVTIDYDQFGRGELAKELGIPRRSTLVVLHGNQELGRIVAGTSSKQIKALLDTALSAAMAA
ncbi:MAG: thioredoxin family protein [Rhodobacteraceae bacterium]|jgi:thioredoxin 1|nr:thioredoxin family protein [Paracoccaceae bacterium]MBT6520827.1 thioredoxin family protein [Paracoccaceae bacterium]MBT7343558.1 thioredoxin family protein [Paracoccaceae bacterium]